MIKDTTTNFQYLEKIIIPHHVKETIEVTIYSEPPSKYFNMEK